MRKCTVSASFYDSAVIFSDKRRISGTRNFIIQGAITEKAVEFPGFKPLVAGIKRAFAVFKKF
jgi:hypothetical protein